MLVFRLPARFPLVTLSALLLGALNALTFLSASGWIAQIVILAALFSVPVRLADTRTAVRAGFAFGLGWFLVGISWIYVSLHLYGLLPAWLAALATFALCSYLAIYPSLALGAAAWLSGRGTPARVVLLVLPVLWMLSEMLRGVMLTGFPWLATGYAQIDGPLAGYAPVIGVYGVTLACALCASALTALGLRSRLPRHAHFAAIGILLAVGLIGYGARSVVWSQPAGQPLKVSLLQGNIPQEVKFDAAQMQATLTTYFALIEKEPADLIVLPETALPIFFGQLPTEVIARLHRDSDTLNAVIATGVPVADSYTHYTNSMVAFSPNKIGLARYDKAHLVPFGEFVPTGFHWFVRLMKIPLGDFSGAATAPGALALAHTKIGFDICYEDLFGAQIARQARSANLLVNASNVAWFGDSLALPEHLQIARMRALESARPMLRATNTGMTAAIDARGTVLARLAPFTVGALTISISPTQGETPYTRWLDWPLWALSLATLLWVLAKTRMAARTPR